MAMALEIREEPTARLAEHAQVPISFIVDRVFDVTPADGGLAGLTLVERRLARPYTKDYDATAAEGPARWARRFDVSRWGLLAAYVGEARVGGAVVAFDTPGLHLLDDRRDLALLWDLRVRPDWRGHRVGRWLFEAAERWAMARGCTALDVETQTINVAACRFYARMGCTLRAIDRFAYPTLADEVQLLWRRVLPGRA